MKLTNGGPRTLLASPVDSDVTRKSAAFPGRAIF